MESTFENAQVAEIRISWSDAAVKLLLDFIKENGQNVGKTFALKNKAKLWKMGSDRLKDEGFLYTPAQIETKFRALERQYKKKNLNNKQTGRARMNCPYEAELNEIFKEKRGIHPEYVLATDALVEETESVCSSPVATPSSNPSSPAVEHDEPKRKKFKHQDQLVQAIEKAAAARQKEHEELMCFLKQKEEQKKADSQGEAGVSVKTFF